MMLTLLLLSCSSDEDSFPEPAANCRITSFVSAGGNPGTISYNSDGKIKSLVSGDNSSTFLYANNTIVINETDQGNFDSKTIVTLNEDELPVNIRRENNEAGTDWVNTMLEYDGMQLSKTTRSTSGGGAGIVTMYTWENGNVLSYTNGNSTVSFEYYEEHPLQQGDLLHLSYYTSYGVSLLRNKNLVKSLDQSGGSLSNFDYEFDADGKIIRINTSSTSGNTEISLKYQCE